MYIQIAYRPSNVPTVQTMPEITTTTTTLYKAVTYNITMGYIKAECPEITKVNEINQTVNVTQYIYDNITRVQKHSLMNIKANKCPSGGCAFGYYLCKEDALTIFDLPHSKFSEAPSSGYTQVLINNTKGINNNGCIPIEKDWIGKYIRLNSTTWEVYSRPDRHYTMVDTIVFNNITELLKEHNLTGVWKESNITYNKTLDYTLRMVE